MLRILLLLLSYVAVSFGAAIPGAVSEHLDIPPDSVIIHDSTLNLELKTSKGNLSFNLTRVDYQQGNIPLLVNDGHGSLQEFKASGPQLAPTVFQDKKNGSVFVFQFNDDGSVDVHARFSLDSVRYAIRPGSSQVRRRRRRSVNSPQTLNIHEMIADFRTAAPESDFIVPGDLPSIIPTARRLKTVGAGPEQRYVEAVAMADYLVFDNNRRYLGTNDTTIILRHMQLYYTLFVAEVRRQGTL